MLSGRGRGGDTCPLHESLQRWQMPWAPAWTGRPPSTPSSLAECSGPRRTGPGTRHRPLPGCWVSAWPGVRSGAAVTGTTPGRLCRTIKTTCTCTWHHCAHSLLFPLGAQSQHLPVTDQPGKGKREQISNHTSAPPAPRPSSSTGLPTALRAPPLASPGTRPCSPVCPLKHLLLNNHIFSDNEPRLS